jgi:hypothetical protein
MTFELVTRYSSQATYSAWISSLPIEAQNLVNPKLKATCTAGEEFAVQALVSKILEAAKGHFQALTLRCVNPNDSYTIPKLWKAEFRERGIA